MPGVPTSAISRESAAVFLLPTAAGRHREGEVRALEAGDQLERIPQAQLGGDILAHVGRRGGRECRGRHVQLRAKCRQAPIVRAEIMPPLADAVGFVDHQPDDAGALQRVAKGAASEPLRGHVE